jgi:ATP-dependent Lhr-like helicase
MLCQTGPFKTVSETNFIALLRAMAAKDLLMQDANGLLLHGTRGERMVNHYTFYAAFPDSQEYRLRHAGKDLGTLPLPSTSKRDDVITFAGRRWSIENIDHEKRLVELTVSSMGKLPRTGLRGFPVHQRVRQQMRALLASGDTPVWLDATAKSLLKDAQRQFKSLQLDRDICVVEGHTVYLFLWHSDQVQGALAVLLANQGQQAENKGICIEIKYTTPAALAGAWAQIANEACPAPEKLLKRSQVRDSEKWDWVLPDDMFLAGVASRGLALEDAHALCEQLERQVKAELK